MQKTALKTFVYSFSVSLFAIFVANGAYWHVRPSESKIKIPNKNITLFLKSSPAGTAAPVKKIALNVLPEIAVLPQEMPDEEIIMADTDLPLIPFEDNILIPEENITPQTLPEKPKKIKTAALIPPPLVKNSEETSPPAIFAPESNEKIAIPLEAPKSTISKLNIAKKEKPVKEPAPQPSIAVKTPEPLLPLERNPNLMYLADSTVKIGNPETLSHVATTEVNIPVNSISAETANTPKEPEKQRDWQQMSEKQKSSDSPWLVAKASGAVQNLKLKEESFQKPIDVAQNQPEGIKVAANTVQNLLIPIPDDIMEEENLVPKLSIDDDKKNTEKKENVTALPAEEPKKEVATTEKPKKGNILSSLSSMFDKGNNKNKEKGSDKKPNIINSIKKKLSESSAGKIMPKEMRLSFQPNRAEISGQTLRWVQAFATNVAKSSSTQLEIRIDGTTTTNLQQKRLNLLYNILRNKGVEEHKIDTVFTQREANSFILRLAPIKKEEIVNGYNKITATKYKQW